MARNRNLRREENTLLENNFKFSMAPIFNEILMIKFSKNKIILLVFAVLSVLAVWFLVITPKWRINIINNIEKVNYCDISSDCEVDYFGGLICGGYVNKNEKNNIDKEIKLYKLLSFDYAGCMGGILSSTPKCENKKCVGFVAD